MTQFGHVSLKLLHRLLFNRLTLLALLFFGIWGLYQIKVSTPDAGLAYRLKVWSLVTWERTEDAVAVYVGEEVMLRQRARRRVSEMASEIERLRWLEAEARAAVETLEQQRGFILRQQESMRTEMSRLAAQIESGSQKSPDTAPGGLSALEVEAQLLLDHFAALQEQIALYEQSQHTHSEAALRARLLRGDAEQQVQTTEAYLTLLEATIAFRRTHDLVTSDGEGSHAQNLQAIAQQLQTQIERNERIIQQRQELERLLADTATDAFAPITSPNEGR